MEGMPAQPFINPQYSFYKELLGPIAAKSTAGNDDHSKQPTVYLFLTNVIRRARRAKRTERRRYCFRCIWHASS